MEQPQKIDFKSNGRVVFTMTEAGLERTIILNKSDAIVATDSSIKIGAYTFEMLLLTQVFVDGVLDATYTTVNSYDFPSIKAKNLVLLSVVTDKMSTTPVAINVDAPVTVETPEATILGYSILSVTDAAVVDLADGVDDASAPVPIPADATGARLVVQFTSTAAKLLFASNGSVPANTPSERGEYVVENKTEIYLGRTPQSSDAVSELAAFKAIMNTAKTATILITYYQMV